MKTHNHSSWAVASCLVVSLLVPAEAAQKKGGKQCGARWQTFHFSKGKPFWPLVLLDEKRGAADFDEFVQAKPSDDSFGGVVRFGIKRDGSALLPTSEWPAALRPDSAQVECVGLDADSRERWKKRGLAKVDRECLVAIDQAGDFAILEIGLRDGKVLGAAMMGELVTCRLPRRRAK